MASSSKTQQKSLKRLAPRRRCGGRRRAGRRRTSAARRRPRSKRCGGALSEKKILGRKLLRLLTVAGFLPITERANFYPG